jgi:hypothetical protein
MIRAMLLAAFAFLLAPLAATATPDDREAGALAPDFEGKVAYFGNYTGTSSVLAEQPRWAKDVPCPYRDHRCRRPPSAAGSRSCSNSMVAA